MATGTVRISKIVYLAIETWFYSIIITVAMMCAGILEYNPEVGLRTFFPLLMREYWFITDYIILLFLTPLLNILIRNTTKKTLEYMVAVLLIVGYFMSSVREYEYISTPFIFIVAYLFAAYLRFYPNRITESKKIPPIIFLICVIFGFILMYLMDGMYQGTMRPLKTMEEDSGILIFFVMSVATLVALIIAPFKRKKEIVALALIALCFASILIYMPYRGLDIRGIVEERYSILMGLSAVSLFLTFKNMKPRHIRAINWLAKGTLGVYLIHFHSFLRTHYWKELFPVDSLMQDWFLLRTLTIIVGLVIVFMILDRGREVLFHSFTKLDFIRVACDKLDSKFLGLFVDSKNVGEYK